MRALGVTGLPMVAIEHPLGGERSEGIARRARQAVDQISALLGQAPRIKSTDPAETGRAEPASTSLRPLAVQADLTDPATTDPATIDDTPEAVLAAFCERQWCDGLPIVPPTEARVLAMLGGASGDRSLGAMPPLWRLATLEKLAVNAVMAGCEPAAFPLVVAAVEAMLDPSFNLYGVQATTHNVNDHVSTTAAGILATVADTAVSLGSNVGWYLSQSQILIVLGPEHARTIAGDGLSRADVQRFVFENARLPLRTLKLGGMWGIQDWPRWMHAVTDDDALLPQVPSPEDVMVIVAGGPGKHSAVVPNCTFSRAVSREIRPL